MNTIDEIEYKLLDLKIRELEEKIIGWNKHADTIQHMINLLKKSLGEACTREKQIRESHGLKVDSRTATTT